MQLRYCIIFFFSCFYAGNFAFCQSIIKASEFGVKSNSFENSAPGIRKAIEACKAKGNAILLLPGGRIDVWPDGAVNRELYISNCTENDTLSKMKKIALAFDHCNNITINGNNSLIVLHGKMISFAVLNSVNIKLKNMRFDYDRPTVSELTIKSVSDTVIETEIHRDSKYWIDSGRISFYGEGWKTRSYHTILFDPAQQTMRYSDFMPFLAGRAVETSPFHVRFEGKFTNKDFSAGEVLTLRDPYRDNCGGLISRSMNIELENVKMHFMHGLGIVSQFSENISLLKVEVAPRENSGRVISAFADCFHFSGCRGLIRIDSCLTMGSQDDAVNIHGTHLQVIAIDKTKKIIVRFMHHQTYGFEAFFPGDSIAFIDPQTLLYLGTAKLRTAKLINKREMQLEVEGMLPPVVKEGQCIENLTWTPDVTIQNSKFERTNTRGLLITTRKKVLIENNVFYHTGMYPILIADDATGWFESGPVRDVMIRHNTFEDCGYNSGSGAIKIEPENHKIITGKMVHSNIRIIGNIFKVITDGVLVARSVDHLLFSENGITHSNLFRKGADTAAFNLTACKNVEIHNNSYDRSPLPVINVSKMIRSDLETDLNVNAKE